MTKFAQTLTNLLELKGLNASQFSKVTQISYTTICSWFNRDSIPSADICFKVAQYLGVTVEYLLTGEDSEKAKSKTVTSLSEAISSVMTSNESSKLNFEARTKIAKHLESALSCLLTGEDKTEEPKRSEIEELYEELSEHNQKELLEYARFKLSQQPKEISKAV